MDTQRFDDLVKRLATGASRRRVLQAGLATIMATVASRGATLAAENIGICHRTGSATTPFVYITVDQHAVPAHQAHGDVINPDFSADPANCGGCGLACDTAAGEICHAGTCQVGCAQYCGTGQYASLCLTTPPTGAAVDGCTWTCARVCCIRSPSGTFCGCLPDDNVGYCG